MIPYCHGDDKIRHNAGNRGNRCCQFFLTNLSVCVWQSYSTETCQQMIIQTCSLRMMEGEVDDGQRAPETGTPSHKDAEILLPPLPHLLLQLLIPSLLQLPLHPPPGPGPKVAPTYYHSTDEGCAPLEPGSSRHHGNRQTPCFASRMKNILKQNRKGISGIKCGG